MKKIIIAIFGFMLISSASAQNIYYPDYVDSYCLVNLENYKTDLSSVSSILSTKYPKDKRYLDTIIFKIVGIIDRKYSKRKSETYKKLAEKIVDYMYDNCIQKGTKAYYKLAYLAYTFYDYHNYYKSKGKFDSFLENIANN